MIFSAFDIETPPDNKYFPIKDYAGELFEIISWETKTPRGNGATFGSVFEGISEQVGVSTYGEIISLQGDAPLKLTFWDAHTPDEKTVVELKTIGDAVHIPGGYDLLIEADECTQYICEYPREDPNVELSIEEVEHASSLAKFLRPGEQILGEKFNQVDGKDSYYMAGSPLGELTSSDRVMIQVLPNTESDIAQLVTGEEMHIECIAGHGVAFVYDHDDRKLTEHEMSKGSTLTIKPDQVYCYVAKGDPDGFVITDTCPGFDVMHEIDRADFTLNLGLADSFRQLAPR